VSAAKAFFKKAIGHEGQPPQTITLDGYAASHRAVREMRRDGLLPKRTKLRSSKYLNNLIEQDHRGIKSRTGPMLGFKDFGCAATTIAGIEMIRRIRKGQFALGRLRLKRQNYPSDLEWSPRRIVSASPRTSLRPPRILHQNLRHPVWHRAWDPPTRWRKKRLRPGYKSNKFAVPAGFYSAVLPLAHF
jgi:hypothetical protein